MTSFIVFLDSSQSWTARCQTVKQHAVVVVSPTREAVDICHQEAVIHANGDARVDMIINAAAYIHVDNAEFEPEPTFRTNRDCAVNAAMASKKPGCPLGHISTDYVFDGAKPIAPSNYPMPVGQPKNTVLDCGGPTRTLGIRQPD